MPIAPDVYKKIVTAKVYIDCNFPEAIDLGRLSREACLSRYHFHRLFTRERTGGPLAEGPTLAVRGEGLFSAGTLRPEQYRVTPHQYLTRKRIEQARKCLAGNELTITEICNEVGFESIGSFSALHGRYSLHK